MLQGVDSADRRIKATPITELDLDDQPTSSIILDLDNKLHPPPPNLPYEIVPPLSDNS